ncbi:hypothetical protein PGN61_20975 [Klebsiella aerogenes]
MPNFFKSAINGALDSVKSPLKVGKDLVHGHFHEAFADLKHMPGNQERANSKTLQSVGIRGWVGKHPGETVAAAAATIFGGWAAWGAYGAGATGGATGALAGSAGATTAGTTGGALGASGGLATGAGSAMAYTPTASSVMIGSSGGVGASGIGATGVGIGGESTAALGISGSGVTSFPALSYGSTGSLGSGTGWLGSDAAPISNSSTMTWQDYAKKFSNNQQSQRQGNIQPQTVDLLHKLMKVDLTSSKGADSGQMQLPQSTTDIIGGNKQITRNDFHNNF